MLLADGREDQVRVARRQIARVPEAETRSRDSTRRHGPECVRNLIAAGNRVVPRRLPHAHAIGQRLRHVQNVPDVERQQEDGEAGDRHSGSSPRHRVDGEKHAAGEERRAEILLEEEKEERHADAGGDGQDVLAPRQVDPRRAAADASIAVSRRL